MIPAAVLAICAFFLLTVYAPFELYSVNTADFSYDLYDLLRYMLPLFAVSAAAAVLIFFILRKISSKLFRAVFFIGSVILVSAYIQGTFFSGYIPSVNGEEFDWSAYSGQRLVSAAVIVFCAAGLFVLFRKTGWEKFSKAVRIFCTLLCSFLALSMLISCFTTRVTEKKSSIIISDDNILTASEDGNFYILLLDCIGTDAYETVAAEHPEYASVFEDFTFFRNTMAAYPFTAEAVPFILSGNWYECEDYYTNYLKSAYIDSPLFSRLEDCGYSMGVYEIDLPKDSEAVSRFDNIILSDSSIRFENPLNFCKMQLELAGLRYCPYDLKKLCLLTPENIYQDTLPDIEQTTAFSDNSNDFYNLLKDGELNKVPEKRFEYIHLVGGHSPWMFDSSVNYTENGSYYQNIEASMTIADTFLKKLKESGVYDNSIIIIMADHGYGLGPDSDSYLHNRQNPILFVKGSDEHHPFSVSEAPVSHSDLMDAYFSLLSGSLSTDCFSCREGDSPARRYLYYPGNGAEKMTEYYQYGEAGDVSTLVPTGNEYYFGQYKY